MIERRPPANPARVTPEQAELLRPKLAQFRIVFVALITGVMLFAGIVIAITGISPFTWPPSMLSMILAGLSAGIAVQAFVLPHITRRTASSKLTGDASERISQLSGTWFSTRLVGAALLESCALLNIVGYLIENNLLHFPLAGLYIALMCVYFPTMNGLLDWIDSSLSSQ